MLTQNHSLFSLQPTASSNRSLIAPSSVPRLVQPLSFVRSAAAQTLRSSSVGRTLGTARLLGLFPGRRAIRQFVGRQNPNFLRFTLNDRSDVRLTLRNRSQSNIVGALLNEQGQLVSLGRNRLSSRIPAGETLKNTFEGLPSGTYYLRIRSRAQGRNTYQLTLAARNTVLNLPCGCGR
jgi:hypothetical protein